MSVCVCVCVCVATLYCLLGLTMLPPPPLCVCLPTQSACHAMRRVAMHNMACHDVSHEQHSTSYAAVATLNFHGHAAYYDNSNRLLMLYCDTILCYCNAQHIMQSIPSCNGITILCCYSLTILYYVPC